MKNFLTKRPVRWGSGVALLAAVTVAVAACGSTGGGGSAGEPLKIGVQFGLTGPNAAFDTTYMDASKLAFKDLEAKGVNGKKVDLSYADDASDPATAVSVARKFATQDKVNVMYGPAFTPTALSTKQIADSLKIPFYTPGSINPGLSKPLDKYTFAPNFSSDDVAVGIAKLAKSAGAKKIGVLVESDAYGQAALDGAKTALAQVGLKVDATAEIAAAATDATSQMRSFKSAGVDFLLLGTTAPPMASALNAQISSGAYIPMATFAGSNDSLDKLAMSDPKISYFALTPLACPLGSSCTSDFMSQWKAAYPDKTPIVWTVQAFEAARAFEAALANTNDYSADGIIKGLETMKPFSTSDLACPITFTADSHKGTSCTNFYGISGGKVSFFGNDTTDNKLGK